MGNDDAPALTLFRNGRLLDPELPELQPGLDVLVEGPIVREISDRPIRSDAARVIDLGGRTLMPGLIDAHVHVFMCELNVSGLRAIPITAATTRAAANLRGMLLRGFTTVRDMAGAEYGLRDSVEAGFVDGPRLFVSGRALSQTGGHGDHRPRTSGALGCGCDSISDLFFAIADGVDEVVKAVRTELRLGADQIKIMVSGGAGSPNDPLESLQYRDDEIAAAVEEATRWGTYVAAHAYTNESIVRCVRQGVRTIEHGNFLQPDAAQLMRESGAFLVPTLITYEYNKGLPGRPAYTLRKIDEVRAVGLRSLEVARSAGVAVGYGTDMQMSGQHLQAHGLSLHAEVMGAREAIRSATVVNARILNREGIPGRLSPGSFADALVVDGDPLRDVTLLQTSIAAVMKAGRFYKMDLRA